MSSSPVNVSFCTRLAVVQKYWLSLSAISLGSLSVFPFVVKLFILVVLDLVPIAIFNSFHVLFISFFASSNLWE